MKVRILAVCSALILGGCTTEEIIETSVEDQKVNLLVAEHKKDVQRRNLVSKSDTCSFSVKLPTGDTLRYRGVASDRGSWRGNTPFSACMVVKNGDKLTVEKIDVTKVIKPFFGGSETREKKGSYWMWTFGSTSGKFL